MKIRKGDYFVSRITGEVYEIGDSWGETLGMYVLIDPLDFLDRSDDFSMTLTEEELHHQFVSWRDESIDIFPLSGRQ